MSLPEPPTDVRLIMKDGTEIAVDTVYDGLDGDGCHLWVVVNPPGWWEVKTMTIEALPPKTAVTFPIEPDIIEPDQGGNDA